MEYIKCGAERFEFEIKPIGTICKRCNNAVPVVSLSTQKLKLCKDCFTDIQHRRVYETVKRFRMFNQEDRIGLYLSGGKDSATLAAILKRVFPNYNFQAIYLNLGIRYYSDQAEEVIRVLCEQLELPLYVYNVPEKEGFYIDEFLFTNFKDKICSVCGTIKRYLFSKIAKELNLTVIATGHHLDDLLSTYLNLFFSGDFLSIKRLSPVNMPLFKGQAKKVKPLAQIPEKEIFYYAALHELPLEWCSCPHGETTPSKKIKKLIDEFSRDNPSFKNQTIAVFFNKFLPILREQIEESGPLSPCLNCGEPTSSPNNICGHCRRIMLLKRVEDRQLELDVDALTKIAGEEKDEWVVFDLREKDDYENLTFPGAKWLPADLIDRPKEFFKTFKPYKGKKLLFFCYSGRISYLFTIKLRKLGFKAYNLKNPKLFIEQYPFQQRPSLQSLASES